MQASSVVWRAVRGAMIVAALTVAGHSVAHDRELAESPDFRVRVQAALRLGRAGAASRADLEGGLRDAHPAVRVACAAALGNIDDPASIPALERAMKGESYATVKTAMKETIDKLRGSAAVKSASPSTPTSLAGARYVVQLGAMKNVSGVRADDLDGIMRQAARAKAGTIKGAVIVDGSDPSVIKKATEKRIPVLQVDGNLTKLTQFTGTDGSTVISAKVDMSIRKLPGQTLKGTVSGNASGSNGARVSSQGILDLQNRVVGGAVESAMGSMGAELASLSK
ncbi:MAG: HEAT repeat domain-containing protein [Myxococcales bacterium]|nr:HEAT repeat domain-containing protein [Myxococcales bacterium]